MPVPSWTPLRPRYRETRDALHTVAEHILGAARYRAVGRIGLQPVRGGFGTPLTDGRWIEVIGTDLVLRAETGEVQREPITTLRSAGTVVDIEPGMPATVYRPATPLDLDAGLGGRPGRRRRHRRLVQAGERSPGRARRRPSRSSAVRCDDLAGTLRPRPLGGRGELRRITGRRHP